MDESTEDAVISVILNHPEKTYDFIGRLTPEHFTDSKASRSYMAAKALVDENKVPTRSSILTYLIDADLVSSTSEIDEYLERCGDMSESISNVDHYISSLRTRRTKKIAKKYVRKISDQIDEASDEDEIASLFGTSYDMLVSAHSDEQAVQLGDDDTLDSILEGETVEVEGIRTGLEQLDSAVGGLKEGTLTTFVGSTNSGKSVILNQIGLDIARRGIPVLHINTEMTQRQILIRSLSQISGVNPRLIEKGKWESIDEARPKIESASEEIKEIPYYFHYMYDVDYDKIYNLAVRYIHSHDVEVVVLDHVKEDHRLASQMDPYRMFGILTTKLKNHLAGKHGVAVLTAQQAKRAARNKLLRMEDIQDSIRIAQESSNVITISKRSESEVRNDPTGADRILLLDKARGAQADVKVKCRLNPTSLMFVEVDNRGM